MPTPTKAVKANPVSGALIDPPVATFCSANGIAQLSDLTSFFDYKGGQNCSTNPNYPAALKGDVYSVTVAGKIGGASGVVVAVGDTFLATADNAGGTQAAVGSSWIVSQANIDLGNIAITGGTITGTTVSGLTVSPTTGTLTIENLALVEFQQQVQTIGTFYAGGDVYIYGSFTTDGDVIFSGAYNTTFNITANTSVTFPTSGTLLSSATAVTAAQGGTGLTSYAVGDLLYASGTTTLSKLADVATGSALISGGITTAPSWGKIGLTTHVSGTLPEANGGTAFTSLVKFHAYKTADQITAGGSYEQVTFPSEEYDTGSNFASNAFTAPVAGKYIFGVSIYCGTAARILQNAIYKNGTQVKRMGGSGGTRNGDIFNSTVTLNLAANDVITVYCYTDGVTTLTGAQTIAYFWGELLPGS